MKKMFVLALVLTTSLNAMAHENDLVLPGAKWIATFKNYLCTAFGTATDRPSALEQYQVAFETVVTDSTLDNGLIKASFVENGTACRYNAILLADNAAATLRLVNSISFATSGSGDCLAGKTVLDAALESNDYLYWGHPHNLSIMAPVAGAREICNADLVGINFVVTGRIQ